MNNKKGNLRIKILTISTAVAMIATGFKLMSYQKQKKALLEEQNELLQEYKELLEEYQSIEENKNTQPVNLEEYNVDDVIEVGGRTIYVVSDITPTPTPTPPRYVDTTSDEYIMAEDGWLHDSEEVLNLEFTSINQMISFYSKVFQLDDEIVANKIYELIDSNEYAWENETTLNGKKYDSEEQAIARTIADIALFPEDYGLEKSAIEVDEYELDGYEPEELIYKFSEVIGVNPNIALAVAYTESGSNLDSYNFTHNYNVGGLHRRSGDPSPTTSSGYVIYKNPADGLFRFVVVLHDGFFVNEDSGIDRLNCMASTYCEIPDHWRNLAGGIYRSLVNDGYTSIYDSHNNDRDLIYPVKSIKKTNKK